MSGRLTDPEVALLKALTERLGRPHGMDGPTGRGAFAATARKLHAQGVLPSTLDALIRDFALDVLSHNPYSLAAFLNGGEATDRRHVAVQRWPTECARCRAEIGRGELAWLRRVGESWSLTCQACEPLDHGSERAEQARRIALEREKDDPDDLLQRIIDRTPVELREQVGDDLTLRLAAAKG